MNKTIGIGIGMIALAMLASGCERRSDQPSAASEAQSTISTTGAATGQKKILYYRNPMGQSDTSPTPKKDSMGMDYIPVYEGDKQ